MKTTAVVTIVSNNYLHYARTLMQSVARQHPQADRYCVIVDRDTSHAAALAPEFQPLQLDQLQLPDGDTFLFQYNVLELNTAVKPWALAHLLQSGYQQVIYIDPDITLHQPLTEVLDLLAGGADVVLTPHLLAPMTDAKTPTELDIRRAGAYNLGFCATRASSNTLALLHWWQSKLRRDCVIDHNAGIFVDQSWMDLAPGLFEHIAILRHPGYNMAYWNIAQRPVQSEPDGLWVAGQPLVFFHFSGLNPDAPQNVSRHQNRFTLATLPPELVGLITHYLQTVNNNGLAQYRLLPYSYGHFDDGTPIKDAHRIRYRTEPDLRQKMADQPFARADLFSHSKLQDANQSTEAPAAQTAAEQALRQAYGYFLGRGPDATAYTHLGVNLPGPQLPFRHILAIATSPEARSTPGWLQRLLGWPFHKAQFAMPSEPNPVGAQPAPARALPSPYGGLYAPEPDSATQGLWVGPRLDLPVCTVSAGHLCIAGTVDLALLAHGQTSGTFTLQIYGGTGLLHTESIQKSGPFTINLTVPPGALTDTNQWTLLASQHTVPKAAGLNDDTRALAWRVTRISVDDNTLIDSTRSPATLGVAQLLPAPGVNLVGYLSAELGVGEGTRALARSLVAAGIPYSAHDISHQTLRPSRDTSMLTQAVAQRFAIDLIYVNADQTAATASQRVLQDPNARYRIGYWVWEQPQLPSGDFGAFAHVDEIWVPSTFAYHAIAPYSPVPVVIIPHAIACQPSPGCQRAQFGLPADKLLVLVMYDFHSYQYRKNPQAAVAAFRQACAGRTDSALVIKTINGQHHTQALQALKDSVCDLAHVIFIDNFLTRQQTWDLQACCDVLLSLHRAEGFGLAPAEMMHLGKPVIATGWSANTDFMTTDNSCPVHFTLKTLEQPVGVYPAGQLWAEADINHASACLTRLLDDPALRQAMGERAASSIRQQLSPQAVGALVRQRLSMLAQWHPPLRKNNTSCKLNSKV